MRTNLFKLFKQTEFIVPTNKAKIFSYIEPELKAELEALAQIRNRSLSNLIETLARLEVEQAKASGELPQKN
jgi:hypothetical protein